MKDNFENIDLMDALLREHANRGKSSDEEMVDAIFAETIYKASELPQPSARPAFGIMNWMKVAAMVTLFLGFGAMLLMQIKGGAKREESFFQLSVTYLPDSQVGKSENPNAKSIRIQPKATINLVEVGTELTSSKQVSADWIESFAISADETLRSEGGLEYAGDVKVDHPSFKISADRLVVSNENSQSGKGAFHAYGAVVERTLENGEVEIARADELVYEPAARSLMLFGKNLKFTAGGHEHHFENGNVPGEMLILRPDGYQVVRL